MQRLNFEYIHIIATEAAYAKGDNDQLALDRIRHGLRRDGNYRKCLICGSPTRRYEGNSETRFYFLNKQCGHVGYQINMKYLAKSLGVI